MARKKHPPLDIMVDYVPHPDAAENYRKAVDLLVQGFTDLIFDQVRAEVAAELGVTPDELDRRGRRKTATEILTEPDPAPAVETPPIRALPETPEGQWFAVLASRNDEELRRFDVQVVSAPAGEELVRARQMNETTDGGVWRIELIESVDGPKPPASYP